jgi:uncharacterized protein YndB with AHSA1/START domain
VDLRSELPRLLPAAIAWAEARAKCAAAAGAALSLSELDLARAVGVARPELVRVETVGELPLPHDPALREAALQTGLLGPDMIGLTLGHSILVCRGHRTPRLLSHELRHVRQYEQCGSIAAFLPVYLMQIVEFGYQSAPYEQDARRHERVELCPQHQPRRSRAAKEASMSERTVRLHRVIRAKPEKVYRAFLEAEAMAKWIPPYGFTCTVHHMDARVGGTFRMSFHNFSSGNGHSFGGEYLELVPSERIRYTDKFEDPGLPGVLEVTVSLKPVLVGTELGITQSGIPDAIPLEMCYLGWQESLAQLATLVEPEIPG